jgi:hypothetical protein
MNSAVWTQPRPGSGLLLLLALIGAMAWPLWHWRNSSHPLAGMEHVDLCARLGGSPGLASLRPHAFRPTDAAGKCEWSDAGGVVQLDTTLYTIRSLAQDYSPPQRIDRYYNDWLAQIRPSGADAVVEQGQPGQRTLRYVMHPRGATSRQAMVEDHGTLLWITSNTMDAAAFAQVEEPLRAQLRVTQKYDAISHASPAGANHATSPDVLVPR